MVLGVWLIVSWLIIMIQIGPCSSSGAGAAASSATSRQASWLCWKTASRSRGRAQRTGDDGEER